MGSVKSQKKLGVILSYGAQAVQIITTMLYVPVILRVLGQQEYGLYQLSTSIVSNLAILTMGFDSAYIRFYSRFNAKNEKEKIAQLNGMFLIIFSVISIVCLLCGSFLVTNVEFVLGDKLSLEEYDKAQILMAVLVVTMAVSFLGRVFQAQVSAHNKFIWLKGIDLLSNIFNPFLSLPLLLLGYGSVSLVTVSLVLNILSASMNCIFAITKLQVKYNFSKFDFTLFKEMSHFVVYIFMNVVIEQINWTLDKYLLGRLRGTESVAVYGVGSQIITIYRSIASTIRAVFVPQINDMVAKKFDMKEITKLFTKLGRIIYLVTFLILSGFGIFGRAFIDLWVGEGYSNAYYVALFPMIVLLISLIQSPGIDIQRAMNLHKARSIAYLIIAIANVGVSIYLIDVMGEIGAALGTAITHICGQGIFMNIYYHKRIGLDIISFWKSIAGYLPASLLSIVVGLVIINVIDINTWLLLCLGIMIYVCIYGLLFWFVGIDNAEKQLIMEPIRSIIKKIRK